MSSHEQSMSEASSSAAATAATANDDAPNAAAVDTEQFRALYERIDLLDKKIKATQRAEKEAPPAQAVIDLVRSPPLDRMLDLEWPVPYCLAL